MKLHSTVVNFYLSSQHIYTHTTILQPSWFCPGQTRSAGTRRNIHPLTLIVVIIIPICFLHLLRSMTSSLFNPRALQSFSTISLQVSFGRPLGLAPFTSYSIHYFTQSLSSFRNTCPYHRNLFCCSTEIMSSKPSLPLNSLLGTLSCNFTLHNHLTILISALIFFSYRPGLTSMQHTASHTTAVQSPSPALPGTSRQEYWEGY